MKISLPYLASLCLVMTILFSFAERALCQSDAGIKADSVSQENATYVTGITSARARSLAGGVLGFVSIVIGWSAKARVANIRATRARSRAAMALGLIAIILSIVHLAVNTGGFGTGSGKAGAIAALALGITGATLGCRSLLQLRSQ